MVPAAAVAGAMVFSSGARAKTVTLTGRLVPPGVVAVMFWAPSGALPATTMVAVMVPKLVTGVPLRVMPVGRVKVPPTPRR